MSNLIDKAKKYLAEKESDSSGIGDPQPAGQVSGVPFEDGTQLTSAQQSFDLNAGTNPRAAPIRKAHYPVGSKVRVNSPMVGLYDAQVLRDDGVLVWVFSPFTRRETAVPNMWLVRDSNDDQG